MIYDSAGTPAGTPIVVRILSTATTTTTTDY
jgi:hypothetical protein